MRKIRKVCLLLVLGVFTLLVSGCILFQEAHLTILEDKWTREYNRNFNQWRTEIKGSAVNDGDYNLELAEIEATIYNTDDEMLDRNRDMIFNLRRNEVWRFSVMCWSEHEPDYYDVRVGRIFK